MSGFEVAGVVLGAFPIAIWALEQYRDVARRVGFWYEIRLEYQKSSNELKFHHVSFVQNLKQLLLPAVSDDAQLKRLINEPGGEAWKDPQVAEALERRLQGSYGLYLEIIGEIRNTMQELNKELAVDTEGVQKGASGRLNHQDSLSTGVSRIRHRFDRANREYQLFRVRFSMSERPRSRLFAELQTYNERLEKLAAKSDLVSKLQEVRQASKTDASHVIDMAVCKFWKHADGLYRALLGAWNCNCRDQHCARLVLEHRTTPDRIFRLLFSSGQVSDRTMESWPRCPVRIKVHKRQDDITLIQQSISVLEISTPQHRIKVPARGALGGRGRRVGRARGAASLATKVVRTAQSGPPNVTLTVTVPPNELGPGIPSPNSSRITSLCDTLNEGVMTSQEIKYAGFVESEDVVYEFSTEGVATNMDHDTSQEISLAQILSGDVRPRLTRRQRYHLSLTITSSFIQLKDTPWLYSSWNKQCVLFSRGKNAKGSDVLLLDEPFVTRDFNSAAPPTAAQGGHDVAGIASLGIILLELCFGRAIESEPSRLKFPGTEDGQINAAFDLLAALEWLKEVNDEAGSDYAGAVEWCLAGCRTLPATGDRAWRQHMLEKVVVPLEKVYKYLVPSG